MAKKAIDKLFDYTDMDFGLKIGPAGTVVVNKNVDCINNSLRAIFSTVSGERVRSPIGSDLLRLLFEPMNAETVRDIRETLSRDILEYEPRVKIRSIRVKPSYRDLTYHVQIIYDIIGRPETGEFSSRLKVLGTF